MISANLAVESMNRNFGAVGDLICTNNGSLFSKNTSVSNTTTICDVTAQWIVDNEVECYTGSFTTNT